jgi:colanic acid/amylovoran biosynthesis protein
MQKITIGLLTADLNSANMGCNALGYSAISLLEEVSKLLGYTFEYKIFRDMSAKSLEWYPDLNDTKIEPISPVVTFRNKVKRVIMNQISSISRFKRSIDVCDIFFEIAGGDSFSDIYGIQRLRMSGCFHSIVANKGKPLIFLPQTIGPFECVNARKIASKSLTYASRIFVRDPISYKIAVDFTGADKVSKSIDMAFFMRYQHSKKNTGIPRVGINPSALLWNRGYTGDNQFGLKVEYNDLIHRIIGNLTRKKCKIIFVPHVLHGPGEHVEDDYKICKMLQLKYPFSEIGPYFYTPIEAKSYISSLDLLIGSRMHCCIAAYSSGVPIYPLAYSRKFKDLFEKELDYAYGAELVSEDIDYIIAGLSNILENMPKIKEEMQERLERISLYKELLVKELIQVVSENIDNKKVG